MNAKICAEVTDGFVVKEMPDVENCGKIVVFITREKTEN